MFAAESMCFVLVLTNSKLRNPTDFVALYDFLERYRVSKKKYTRLISHKNVAIALILEI